uniref:Uncharacterized protein n=1 Tax=Angiostrongylus cantonensis TaxID=6313 RepID=A0A0K0D2Y4_ANGCA
MLDCLMRYRELELLIKHRLWRRLFVIMLDPELEELTEIEVLPTKVPVLFLPNILRYKPVFVLEGACLSLTRILLVCGEGVVQMRLMQIAIGALML